MNHSPVLINLHAENKEETGRSVRKGNRGSGKVRVKESCGCGGSCNWRTFTLSSFAILIYIPVKDLPRVNLHVVPPEYQKAR